MEIIVVVGEKGLGQELVSRSLSERLKYVFISEGKTLESVTSIFGEFPDRLKQYTRALQVEMCKLALWSEFKGAVVSMALDFNNEEDWAFLAELEAITDSSQGMTIIAEVAWDYDIKSEIPTGLKNAEHTQSLHVEGGVYKSKDETSFRDHANTTVYRSVMTSTLQDMVTDNRRLVKEIIDEFRLI